MPGNALIGRVPYRIAAVIAFLQAGPGVAGEFRHLAGGQFVAKIEIGEIAVERVVVPVIVGLQEQGTRRLGPMVRGGGTKRVLAGKMMEEGTFCDSRHLAQLIDGRRRKPLLPDQRDRRVQQLGAGVSTFGGHGTTRLHR